MAPKLGEGSPLPISSSSFISPISPFGRPMRSVAFIAAAAFAGDELLLVDAFIPEIGVSSRRILGSLRIRSSAVYKNAANLQMVRNVDLPEAVVFYGLESVFEPPIDNGASKDPHLLRLRPGMARILDECKEVGTAALILSEYDEFHYGELKQSFSKAWTASYPDSTNAKLQSYTDGNDSVLSFRCITEKFTPQDDHSSDEFADAKYIYYNLQSIGRSPSPAFLIDSLQSIQIDPRGFGGSSGFARGQWVEPRRSPMTARTVVFVAGDWKTNEHKLPWFTSADNDYNKDNTSTVLDRCAAVRAAGCRVIYLENLDPKLPVEDNEHAISRCDAVIDTYGNDNSRDIQPISLDAISTPGDYWLNPPCPRDDSGNAVVADDIIQWFCSERDMKAAVGNAACVVAEDGIEDEMSEDEMARILADLDTP
ncbi:hypothetical protein ACHAXN_005175 [Cyclotella atomus]